jgi:hypothetical protein
VGVVDHRDEALALRPLLGRAQCGLQQLELGAEPAAGGGEQRREGAERDAARGRRRGRAQRDAALPGRGIEQRGGEPRLAHTGGADQQKAGGAAGERLAKADELPLAADQRP